MHEFWTNPIINMKCTKSHTCTNMVVGEHGIQTFEVVVVVVWGFFSTIAHSLLFLNKRFVQIYINVNLYNNILFTVLIKFSPLHLHELYHSTLDLQYHCQPQSPKIHTKCKQNLMSIFDFFPILVIFFLHLNDHCHLTLVLHSTSTYLNLNLQKSYRARTNSNFIKCLFCPILM